MLIFYFWFCYCKGPDGSRVVGLFIPSIAVCISKVSAYSLPVQICAILIRFILPAILTVRVSC